MGQGTNIDAAGYVEADKAHVWHHLLQHQAIAAKGPMIVTEAKGLRIKDINGREYLDATSGGVWWVNVGYGRDRIANAVCEQLKKMPYYAGTAGNIPHIEYAAKLIGYMPGLSRVYLSNSGSEANEKAFKMIRSLAHIKGNVEKKKIIFRNRDYHGTTIAALSATGQPERKEWFGPFVPGFVEFPHACCYRCAFNKTYPGCNIECARALETVIKQEGPETVGGVIVEPITAGGGVIPPVPEYYPILQEICRKYDVLMIMDEVVCGFGRTGKFWGHQHFDVDPEIITMAKGLASSYEALSATVVKQKVYNTFLNDPANPETRLNYFRDISTYGGCTSSLTAALESTRIIEDENLLDNSVKMGAYMLEKLNALRKYDVVGDVRGEGLFAGIEFVMDKTTKEPVTEGQMAQLMGNVMAQNVIVGRTNSSFHGFNNIMNFAPCLIITKEQVDTIVAAVATAIEKTF